MGKNTMEIELRHVTLNVSGLARQAGLSAALADSLLRAVPELTILATSREALRLSGETTWQVPSLAFPDPESFPPPSGDALPALERRG